MTKQGYKIIVPYVKTIEALKYPLKKSNCKLVFTYRNKLKNKITKNKPKMNGSKSGVHVHSFDNGA